MMIYPWHWLVLCLILLGIEAIGVGGFLIGAAIAALLQSIIAVTFENLSWDLQLAIYAINTLVITVIHWRYFRKFNQKTDAPTLNNRAAQYIGRKFTLEQAVINGEGKVKIGDTLWRVRAEHDIAEGVGVEVIDADGLVLVIRAFD